jgi:hypothetical protein
MNRFLLITLALMLAACTSQESAVRVTTQAPVKPVVKATPAVPQTRTEPVFYNGKTYQLHFSPAGPGAYAMTVSGMSAKQAKDAEAVATSSLRYFACKEGHTGKLIDKPSYNSSVWRMSARCT